MSDDTIFGLSHEILDDDKPLVVIGMAGAAKSTNIFRYYSKRGSCEICASTVRLMKVFAQKFGCKCNTIAGGTHTAGNGHFFIEEKDIDADYPILDEVLQTNDKVFDWVLHHRKKHKKIILMTDDRQMLPPIGGKRMLKKFNEFCSRPDVHVVRLTETLRPVNDETRKLYHILYDSVEKDDGKIFDRCKNLFKQIDYEDMPFISDAIYITHTNDDEEDLYIEKDIPNRTDRDFIPKGRIAKKEGDLSKHAVLCQNQANRLRASSYLQDAGIGTTTRFEGSEVKVGQKCFYIIKKDGRVCNREFYTAVTRCKDMNDFIIVIKKAKRKRRLKTFHGIPIKDEKVLSLSSDDIDASIIKDGMILGEGFDNILKINVSPEFAYNPDVIYIDGKKYHRYSEEKIEKGKINLRTLLKDEPNFQFDMEEIYKILDKNGILFLDTPHISNVGKNKDDNRFYLDLFSAYPHIMSYGYMPKNSVITFEESPKKINFYYVNLPEFHGKIITGNLGAALYDKYGPHDMCYLFSLDYTVGCKMGKFLEEASIRSIESKEEVKKILWGILDKKYFEWCGNFSVDDTMFNGHVVRREYNRYGILMVGILSELYKVMIDLSMIEDGYICVDALHFNDEESIPKLIEKMKQDYPFLRYRIVDKKDGSIVYKNYEDLKTEADIKKAQARERQRRRREKLRKEK